MIKETLTNLNIKNINKKRILLRADLNVPLEEGNITDDSRIKAILPTLEYLIKNQGKIIIFSHLGRVKEQKDKQKLSLKKISEKLSYYLQKEVFFSPDTRGKDLEQKINNLLPGEVLLVENTRFEDIESQKESNNNSSLAKYWAYLGDVFINDAFGTSHRAHSSNVGIATYINKKCFGFLVEKEINFLNKIMQNPKIPLVAVLGGSKVSDKIKIISRLLEKVDFLLIGGGMCFTFFKAQGLEIGKSLFEENEIPLVKELLKSPKGKKIILPQDVVCGEEFSAQTKDIVCDYDKISPYLMGLDIGPKTVSLFKHYLLIAKTIVWNGPLGVFEFEKFSHGTYAIAEIINNLYEKATTIIGGGDSAAAVVKFGFKNNFSHISTGGGAFLEYLEGKEMPGLKCIEKIEI
ncbi:phosphoglycerate kinase [Candidatus Phytoplasma pini]|uniref:Phosphoglycerate kinase n=1 Tax=Candidatus Phytoplasma pini TaxID=267362 RepID=A0A559KJ72_9MOLU|nr:phosphoglycerate kinase [Candidatus Phytoplasma pini]TVY12185.1 3-phosphoglycerate kinase [Candidatus Phytoplasma pini]